MDRGEKRRTGSSRIVLAIVVMILFGLTTTYQSLARDIPRPADSDLLEVRTPVADADNAYVALMAATALHSVADGRTFGDRRGVQLATQMKHGKEPWDDALVNRVLITNTAFRRAVEEAFSRPLYQSPAVTNFTQLEPELALLMGVSKEFSLLSAVHRRAGELGAAAEAAGSSIRLSKRILRQPSSLVEGMVGVAIRTIALYDYLQLAQQGATLAQIRSWRESDGGWQVTSESVLESYRAEYGMIKNAILDLAHQSLASITDMVSGGVGGGDLMTRQTGVSGVAYQPNRTLATYQDLMRAMMDAARLPAHERDPHGLDERMEQLCSEGRMAPNPLGRKLLALLVPPVDRIPDKWTQANIMADGIELLAALHAFRRAEGRLPETLDELVPAYLPAVPMDRFSGEPMRYDPQRGIFYSVGRDRKDDGGAYDEESIRLVSSRRDADLVFLIDPPLPQ